MDTTILGAPTFSGGGGRHQKKTEQLYFSLSKLAPNIK